MRESRPQTIAIAARNGLLAIQTWCAGAATVAAFAGCGGQDLVPVEGAVTLDRAPFEGVIVTMERTSGPIAERIYSGKTDAAGRYTITGFGGDRAGAPAGAYRVSMTTVEPPVGANELTVLPKERVPATFKNGQEFEVPPDGTKEANFLVTSR